MLLLQNNLTNAVDNREFVIKLFLDLSKVFDTINHNIVLNKLEYKGIRGVVLNCTVKLLNNGQPFFMAFEGWPLLGGFN